MNGNAFVILVLVLGAFLAGCTSSQQSGYASYNQQGQPQGQPQGGQYVGGGCGVAPSGDYASTPAGAFGSSDSVL